MSRSTDCLIDLSAMQDCYDSMESATGKQPGRLARTLALWNERYRQRGDLRKLADSPHLLRDVGLSLYDVQREADKPFWRE